MGRVKLSDRHKKILRAKFKKNSSLDQWVARLTPVEWIYMYNHHKKRFVTYVHSDHLYSLARVTAALNSGISIEELATLDRHFDPEQI